jgi:hypothetical protein
MKTKSYLWSIVLALSACTPESSSSTEQQDPETLYARLIEKAHASGTYKLVGVRIAQPLVDLDDYDEARWKAEFAWAPSPGHLREIDMSNRDRGIAMRWNEQFQWPPTGNFKMAGPRPSIGVLEVDALIEGRPVHYQAAYTKDFPKEGDPVTLLEPVLGKLAYRPGPESHIITDENFIDDFVEVQKGPDIQLVSCDASNINSKTEKLRASYITSCGWAQDRVELWFEAYAQQDLSCGGPDDKGQCHPTSHNFTGSYKVFWRRCDAPNGGGSDCPNLPPTHVDSKWAAMQQEVEQTLLVEWLWCGDDSIRFKNEFPKAEARILKEQNSDDIIGYAGVQSGQSVLTLQGDWVVELATIATGLTIAYYGVGTLYIASKFASWLFKNPEHTQASRRIGPMGPSPGLKCGTKPVDCNKLTGGGNAATDVCPTPTPTGSPTPTPTGSPTPTPTGSPTPTPTGTPTPTPTGTPTPTPTGSPTPIPTATAF